MNLKKIFMYNIERVFQKYEVFFCYKLNFQYNIKHDSHIYVAFECSEANLERLIYIRFEMTTTLSTYVLSGAQQDSLASLELTMVSKS